MFRAVVLFCAILALTKGQITQVNQCTAGNIGPLPLLTVIEGCRTQPCELPQGQDAVVSIAFAAPHAIQRMRTVATAFLGLIPIPYDLGENAETCNYLISNTSCPVREGELIVHRIRLYIEDFMPVGTQLPIQFSILDDNNVPVTCIRVTVRIVPPVFNTLRAQNAAMPIEM